MANTNANIVPVRLAVFDDRRGHKEGNEHEKMLCYYPPAIPLTDQINHVGFAQACAMFADNFGPEDQETYSIEADAHRWLVCKFEPGVWCLLVVSRQLATPSCTTSALQAYVRCLHSTLVLLHGSINDLLEQDSSSALARRHLAQHMCNAAQRLARHEPQEHAALVNPLAAPLACPFLPVSRRCYTEIQTLASSLSTSALHGQRPVLGVLLAYDQYVLWSTHSMEDSAALWRLASSALLPQAKSSRWQARPGPAQASTNLASAAAWRQQPSGFILPAEPSSPAGQGPRRSSSVASASSGDTQSLAAVSGGMPLPAVHLQGGQECCRLLPYRCGRLLVLLQLQEGQQLGGDLQALLLQLLQPRAAALAEMVAAEVPGPDTWHVKGYRYLYLDDMCCAVRCSPLAKVGTLSASSLELLAELRSQLEAQIQQQRGRQQERQQAQLGSVQQPQAGAGCWGGSLAWAQLEVACRAAHDCWAVARVASGRALLVAMERSEREGGFLAASRAVQALADAHFPGVFL